MITRLSAGVTSMLAFASMLVIGYLSGNPFHTIILRALVGLGCGFVVGYLAGHVAQSLITDHFRAMVEADIDAELAGKAASPEPSDKSSKDGEVGTSGKDKEDNENSRRYSQAARQRTLSAKAAREVIGRS